MNNARCMKVRDMGDGVTVICGLPFQHSGNCAPSAPRAHDEQTCETEGPSGVRCFRRTRHDGPCKFST